MPSAAPKGEKLYEETLSKEEKAGKTSNELIFIGRQIEIDTETFMDKVNVLISIAEKNDDVNVVEELRKIVPTFVKPEVFNEKALKKFEQKENSAEEKELQKI